MEDFKLTFASNLIRLRTAAGLTQAELGEKLSYSDKSVSKWERAESLPDAFVLQKMAGIFGVSIDYLLTGHDEWKPQPHVPPGRAAGDGKAPQVPPDGRCSIMPNLQK